MRPGQNRRVRGRNRNKGPNPLTRTYESNGPDVKIRGTAQHVADKYAQLARDAQASGDPVSAENYFQHAEHYYRMIAAAQEQLRQQYGTGPRPFDDDGEDGDEDGVGGYGPGPGGDRMGGPDEYGDGPGFPAGGFDPRGGDRPAPPPQQQQPRFDRDRQNRQGGGPPRFDRNERFERPQGGERQGGERYERSNGERYDRGGGNNGGGDRGEQRFGGSGGDRFDRPNGGRDRYPPRNAGEGGPREFQGQPQPARDQRLERPPAPFRPEPRFVPPAEEAEPGDLPAFLTNPVRPIAAMEATAAAPPAAIPGSEATDEGSGFGAPRIPRRRRTRKPEGGNGGDSGPEGIEGATE